MPDSATVSAAKPKKRKSKKKVAGDKPATNGATPDTVLPSHLSNQQEDDQHAPDSPTKDTLTGEDSNGEEEEEPVKTSNDDEAKQLAPTSNGKFNEAPADMSSEVQLPAQSDLTAKLDAMVRERDALKTEVSTLRKELQDIQEKHVPADDGLAKDLEEAQAGRDHWETQYNQLLERVNTIRSQLGERLKADRAELAQAQTQIEELEEQNRSTCERNDRLEESVERLNTEKISQEKEIASLRSRATLSQQNWIQERDELISREAYAREEFEGAKQAMQDWENIAREERSERQHLSERVAELEEQLSSNHEGLDRLAAERDTQNDAVEGLQRALRDVQEARKKELRELVESSQSQLEALQKQLQTTEDKAVLAHDELENTRKELDRAMPFEKEVKEKNLLIGKLRHEAVTINDHLTKALRILKQRRQEDMVDRQLVTNHFLQFIALDRADPKKFQILQIISALLSWTDEQNQQAGLSRPGAASTTSSAASSLRLPLTSFRRASSQTALANDLASADTRTNAGGKESLAELWSDFLEREASEGQRSRKGSDFSGVSGATDKKPSGTS